MDAIREHEAVVALLRRDRENGTQDFKLSYAIDRLRPEDLWTLVGAALSARRYLSLQPNHVLSGKTTITDKREPLF